MNVFFRRLYEEGENISSKEEVFKVADECKISEKFKSFFDS